MAEITETARNAEAQIAELASHSTEDDARHLSNNNSTHHDGGTGSVSTPDGNIRPVPAFVTVPHSHIGQSVIKSFASLLAVLTMITLMLLLLLLLLLLSSLQCIPLFSRFDDYSPSHSVLPLLITYEGDQ